MNTCRTWLSIKVFRLCLTAVNCQSRMSFDASDAELRNSTKFYLNDAKFHLNEAVNKLSDVRFVSNTPLNPNEIEVVDVGMNPDRYSMPIRRQYASWKSRNDSQQLATNLNWNQSSNGQKFRSTSINHSKTTTTTRPGRKIRRMLVSDKTYQRTEPKSAPNINYSDNLRYYRSISDLTDSNYEVESDDSYESYEGIDGDDLRGLKDFRERYYFECHSADAKLKDFVVSADSHTCEHDFVINERLFPEPVYADHEKTSRCRECHLPLSEDDDHKIHLCEMYKTKHRIERSSKININYVERNPNRSYNAPVPLHDSYALRYQPGFKHLSSDSSV